MMGMSKKSGGLAYVAHFALPFAKWFPAWSEPAPIGVKPLLSGTAGGPSYAGLSGYDTTRGQDAHDTRGQDARHAARFALTRYAG